MKLTQLTERTSLGYALEVGRIVIESLYDGNVSAWRERHKQGSALRSLAARPDLPLSVPSLYRALGIYELSERCGFRDRSWHHVGVSHLRAVLGLDPDAQSELLERAEREQWSVVRLEQQTRSYREAGRRLGGRRPVPPYLKSIRRIYELTAPEALEGLEKCTVLEDAILVDLRCMLREVQVRLTRITQLLPGNLEGARSSLADT